MKHGTKSGRRILYRGENSVSFVRSTKALLVRSIREKGIELSAERLALADDLDSWKADPAWKGT